jgi:hypothetical protein
MDRLVDKQANGVSHVRHRKRGVQAIHYHVFDSIGIF